MFEHKLSESITNRVEMTDIDGETLAELLRYIYTGQVKGWKFKKIWGWYQLKVDYKVGFGGIKRRKNGTQNTQWMSENWKFDLEILKIFSRNDTKFNFLFSYGCCARARYQT